MLKELKQRTEDHINTVTKNSEKPYFKVSKLLN